MCDSDVICNSCSYKRLKVDENVCIGNVLVSDTPKTQFYDRGQALSPKSILFDMVSTFRSHILCVIC